MTSPTADILLYDHPGSICSQMARLALEEKQVPYRRQTIDIMDTAEQFQPWYTVLNPRAVVPTLRIGEEIVTDTIKIVHHVDRAFDGPALTPPDPKAAARMETMLGDIMGLHYGVLLYHNRREPDGTAPIVVERGALLRRLRDDNPELSELLDRRIVGNERLQAILADKAEVDRHIGEAEALVGRINDALSETAFVSAETYSLADTFATAALARFRVHGFDHWWSDGRNAGVAYYYGRVKDRPSFAAAEVIDTGSERDL